jgi:hypothetical protein
MTDSEFRRIVWAAVTSRAASLAEALDATITVPCDGAEAMAVDGALSRLNGQIRDFRTSLMLRAVMAGLDGHDAQPGRP